LVGNSLLSKFGSEQDTNKNSGNINISFFIRTDYTLYEQLDLLQYILLEYNL
jgi:hypothetical protein